MQIENWQDLQPHPLANLVPRMTPTQQAALNKDIKDKGLRFPIVVVSDGSGGFLILDGRNRHEACVVEKIDPDFWEYPGDDLSGFVVSTLQRKDLTWSEKTTAIKNLLAQRPDLSSRAVAREFDVGNKAVDKIRREMAEEQTANMLDAHSEGDPDPAPIERVTKEGKKAPGRKPDTPEQRAAKKAAKAVAKAGGERKPISSVRETRIDFVNNWLKADVPGALTEIIQLASGYYGRIQTELSGAVRRQHLTQWAAIYGYAFSDGAEDQP